jgi:hypothetical protein
MKIMLDVSPKRLAEKSEQFDYDFWQLRTPLTSNAISDAPYGLDNGCFKRFDQKTWERMLDECFEIKMPKFVCLPDIVGNAQRTIELFKEFELRTNGLPRALVLQDGINHVTIDWSKVSAVFVGGSDAFKISPDALQTCKAAKMLGKWVHVGRVNTVERLANWIDIADSIDGSGISKYDYMLQEVVSFVKGDHCFDKNISLFAAEAS